MVDVSARFKCGRCGNEFYSQGEAERCCKPIEIDYGALTEFELKKEHLDLLKQAWVDWCDVEFGAPQINPKRPYGNSDVEDDIAEIIKMRKKGNWDHNEEMWNEEASAKLEALHKETQVALQIVLHCQIFKPGLYRKKDRYRQEWEFVGSAGEASS